MVLQKQCYHGFNGSRAPTTPQATRSARRRAKFQRRVEDNQMCAFDLLATVAGKLLQEKENPAMSSGTLSVKDQDGFVKECQDANKPFKPELSDERSCDNRCSFDLAPQMHNQNCCLNELPRPEIDGHSGNASMVTSSSCSERYVAEKWVDGKSNDKVENFISKVQLDSSDCPEVSFCKLDGDTSKVKDKLHNFEKVPIGTGTEMCSFEDQLDEKPPAPISRGSNAKLSKHNDKIPSSSPSKGCDNVPVVNRDDDENFSGCTQPSNKRNSPRPMTCIGDRRIRKLLASKYWKVAQDSKDNTLSNSDGNLRPIYDNKRSCYKRQRCQMNIPFKKRKLFNGSSVSNSKGFIRNGGIYYSPKNDPAISSSEARQHSALRARGSHVKLGIKSFRVPELFIEIPETATIGSLKSTVMEAMTAVLGGGLRVGVILHGKKVSDDSKTLLQTGISHGNQRDALGFTLEPKSSQSLQPVCAADSPHVPSPYIAQSQIRYPSSPVVIQQRIQDSSDMLPEDQGTGMGNLVESDHDSAPSSINTSVDKGMTDSKAQVTVPKMDMDALAMVPVLQKSKHSEIVQRRIRRPFSVDEVEALVQAVEILGTGRWRDVKLHAFDNAKHRTYVDLKDKWKTLVHTARISPQQRRGEPVPQQLLDRVLTAQAYWSEQQTKQQNKQHREACLLFK